MVSVPERLEWNADSIEADEIVQRVLNVAAHACNDNDGETFINDETSCRELRHRDRGRRTAALDVVDACSALAHLRAEKYEQTYFEARYSILSCDLLDRDLADPDPELSCAAQRVWDAVRSRRRRPATPTWTRQPSPEILAST